MRARLLPSLLVVLASLAVAAPPAKKEETLYKETLNVNPPHISTDKAVKYDYDIVYVRAKRAGDKIHKRFYTDIATPVTLEPGADLMLLHPDGKEELLVAGADGAITDPVVSFDGEWVYYVQIYTMKGARAYQPPAQGADIHKIHLKTRKIVRLTNQVFTPNTGAAPWSSDARKNEQGKTYFSYGVLNMGPCPLPGGKLAFTSNRDGFRPPRGYPQIALQLFVMDDADESIAADDPQPNNLHKIGHLNIAGALHPVVLKDGRIIFSSLESQGIRDSILWGIWSIHPDGTNWNPVVSAFDPGGAPNAFHFQAQLSDGALVIEEYYNQNNSGFGSYIKMPASPPDGYAAFGPGYMQDPRNVPLRFGRHDNGRGRYYRMPFMPTGAESLTPFALNGEGEADTSVPGKKDSPRVGKFTHPSGAPDNHLLTVYSPGPVNHQYTYLPQLDGGIYLIKDGKPIAEPGQMLLIKNDPEYNEQWPRAVVPYKRIYGIAEPKMPKPLMNDGKKSPHLPEGTPYALVGSSSLYKRESYPNGAVPPGKTTSTYAGGNDPWKGLDHFTSHGNGPALNWHNQGADAGLYSNDDIHALRILVMEPTTDRNRGAHSGRRFHSHAMERLRVLGEIPVRKFDGDKQPDDPDGNPDTSFLARIPADTPFTFQTIDKDGIVLNMAQTWHQLRPGEIRNDCGGCHAHSQKPTAFESTAAAKLGYKVWDLVNQTPLLTTKAADKSGKKWDAKNEAGLTFAKSVKSVEYFRDVKPILQKSCVACHTSKEGREPAAKLDLDADDAQIQAEHQGKFPGSYYRLALDDKAKFGYKPVGWDSWGYPQASRYIRKMQARRSLMIWKVFGKRLDGFRNDDHPSETKPGSGTLSWKGEEVDVKKHKHRADLDYLGEAMPPAAAIAGTYEGDCGKKIKVEALTDEDRRTLVRWIDLGCPIDLDYDAAHPDQCGFGWMLDDARPVLTVTYPESGSNPGLSRLLIGMHDYYTGLDMDTFQVTADFALDGNPAGENLAPRFKESQGVWELVLAKPVSELKKGKVTVVVRDRQGNESRVVRRFSVKK
jgi:hypothetical protein